MSMDLRHGDCLEEMKGIPDGSVSLICTDPPYFRVKNEPWDRQWDTASGFLEWIGRLCVEWQRILKPNGSLYVFASPQMAARVECKIGETFNVLNTITWAKPNGRSRRACKEALRSYFPDSERIIFAEYYGANNMAKGEAGYEAKCDELRGFVFEPLRKYLADEFAALGWNSDKLNEICGTASMAGRHYTARSQWCLPTVEHYAKLQAAAGAAFDAHLRREYEDLRREYEDLRREYEDLRREYEDLRRPFSVTAAVPYTDVWNFRAVSHYKGKHPCEKPADLIRHIVRTSSMEGDTVMDCFMGTGVVGKVSREEGRSFIGIELDHGYFEIAKERILDTQTQQSMV